MKIKCNNNTSSILKLDEVFPINSIYISMNSTNPSQLLGGGGTWTRIAQGRTLVGEGEGNDGSEKMTFSINDTGGHYKTKINENNLSGNVTISRQTRSYGSHAEWKQYTPSGWAVDAIRDTGNKYAQPIDNLQPYYVTYIWKRTA